MQTSTALYAIAAGDDLMEVLAELSRAGEAWIDATGHLEAVELRVAGEGADPVRSLPGRFTLVHLAGPAGGPFSVTLARWSGSAIEVFGGILVQARSAGITAAIHACAATSAAPLQRAPAPESAAIERPDPVAAPSRGATAPMVPTPMWARAAAASAAAHARNDAVEVDPGTPEGGDRVDHFAFGLCDVLTADGDRLRIRDVQGPGRIREVSLSMLKVMSPIDSDGKRVFRLVRKRPGEES